MIVILDNIRSALNVGSILRSCDAFGVKEVYFCGITPDANSPKVVKTALGAEKTIRPNYFRSTKEAIKKANALHCCIVGLEINKKAVDIKRFKKDKKLALVVGNEVSGIAGDAQNACDLLVKIPMKGSKESLNVAVAFGIAAYIISLDH